MKLSDGRTVKNNQNHQFKNPINANKLSKSISYKKAYTLVDCDEYHGL